MEDSARRNGKEWILHAAYVMPLIASGLTFFACNFIILSRIFYPYELEWIEGGSLQVVDRILNGLPVYSMPSPEYVAPLYMPFYYYLSALSAMIFGKGLPALRLVSYLSVLVAAVLISRSVWYVTRSWMAALLSFLCWGAMFAFCGLWYDVARVDSLWTFLLLGTVTSLVAYRYTASMRYLFLAAISYFLAIFTKQTSLVLAPFFLVSFIAWSNFSIAIRVGLAVAVLALLLGMGLQWHSGGMFYFFTMQMSNTHHFNAGIPWNFLFGDLFLAMPVLLFFSIYFWFGQFAEKRDFIAWGSIFAGFFLVSLLGRWYSGGYFNALMPFHHLWLLMGVSGFSVFLTNRINSSDLRNTSLLWVIIIIFSLNICWGFVMPSGSIPSVADKNCGDQIVKQLSKAKGEVCITRHGYLAYLAGKSFCAHEAFSVDLFNGSNADLGAKLISDTRDKIISGYYQILVLDTQAQFTGYGVDFNQLPYTATDIDCPKDVFNLLVSGPKPLHWLEYNGEKMNDLRAIR